MLFTRDQLQIYRHMQNENDGMEKRYFMQIEIKRRLEWQYSYQTKQTLK